MGALALEGPIVGPGLRAVRFTGGDCLADELCFHACPEPDALRVHRLEGAVHAGR